MMQGDGGSFTHSSFVPRDLSNRIRKGFPSVCNSVAWTLQPACQPFWGLRSLTTRSQCGYELLSAVAMATTANTSSNNVKHGNSRHKIRVFSNVSPLMIEIQRRGIPLPLFPFPYMFWSLTSFPHSAFGVSTSLIFTNLVFLESIPSRSASTPQVQTEHTSNIFHPNTIAHAGKYIRLLWFDGILNITPYSYTPKHILYYGWFLHGKLPAIATTALISLGTGSSMLKPSSIMTWQSGWCLGIGWYR